MQWILLNQPAKLYGITNQKKPFQQCFPYLSNTPTNLCMALLNFSLFCFVLYCYAFVQYLMWRQYNTMPCINLSEYWTTLVLSHGAIDLVRSCYFQVCGCNPTVWPYKPSSALLSHCTICHSVLKVSRVLTTGCLDCRVYAPTIWSRSDLGLWIRMSKYPVAPRWYIGQHLQNK